MTRHRLLPLAALAALALGACEARFGNDAAPSNGSAEGKAEEGRLSISAPGFEMKVNIPESIRREAGIDDDSGVIYPNSRFSGIHVEGGDDNAAGRGDGEVELRFASDDSAETVVRWYRDPARAVDFTVSSASRDGNGFVVAGTTRDNDGRFRARLLPRAGGGTDGRVVLAERR